MILGEFLKSLLEFFETEILIYSRWDQSLEGHVILLLEPGEFHLPMGWPPLSFPKWIHLLGLLLSPKGDCNA